MPNRRYQNGVVIALAIALLFTTLSPALAFSLQQPPAGLHPDTPGAHHQNHPQPPCCEPQAHDKAICQHAASCLLSGCTSPAGIPATLRVATPSLREAHHARTPPAFRSIVSAVAVPPPRSLPS